MVDIPPVLMETTLPLTAVSAVILGASILIAGAWLYYFLR